MMVLARASVIFSSSFLSKQLSLLPQVSSPKSISQSSLRRTKRTFCTLPPTAAAYIAPLFERPAVHRASLFEVFRWRKWAQDMALSVGSRYLDLDGGPDSKDLLRELEWLLEDVVQGSPSGNWKDVKTYADASPSCTVYLRATLEELSASWTERVKLRRPFQYVCGCAHWREFVLHVREGVLIPRPETEQMVDLAEEAIKAHPSLAKGVWADLGTGSGALAIGLACLLDSQGSVLAVDVSEDAVSVARHNVSRYGLQDKVEILCGSWFSVLENKEEKLNGVVSNPPYIPSCQIASLQAEVGKYEPRIALDGGPNGTDDLVAICEGASSTLCSNGSLILETNGGEQAEKIAKYLESMLKEPFHSIQLVNDFAGVVRFVTAVHV